MKTQKEQIQAACFAYIMPLSEPGNTSGTQRFSIYLAGSDGRLEILWPWGGDRYDTDGTEKKKPNLLTHQCYYKPREGSPDKYPAFHFRLSGWGYSKKYDLKMMLKEINPALEV